MRSKEAVAKVVFWRLLISIPVSTIITYLYFGQLFKVVEFVILMNVVMTINHFLFEKIWPKIWRKDG